MAHETIGDVSDQDVTLEPFADRHFAVLASWFAFERDVRQWGGPAVNQPLTEAQLNAMLPDELTPPSHLAWMALADGDWVGHAQVISVDPDSKTARLGRIVIAPAHRGQGLAVPMLRQVIDKTFEMLQIDHVQLGVYTWNVGALRTYERLGFRPAEIRSAATIFEGESWDLQEMSLRRSSHF